MLESNQLAAEVAIFSRVLLGGGRALTPQMARYWLARGFTDEDKARMHELAVKNQAGALSAEELHELDSYIRVSDLLAILQSKARKALKAKPKRA